MATAIASIRTLIKMSDDRIYEISALTLQFGVAPESGSGWMLVLPQRRPTLLCDSIAELC